MKSRTAAIRVMNAAVRVGLVLSLCLAAPCTSLAQITQNGTPSLVQHVATGLDCNGVLHFIITLPNPALSGNCLILGIQFSSSGSITSVTDNEGGNTWIEGPTTTNSAYGQKMATYYALNVTAGTQVVTIAFSGLSGTGQYLGTQGVLSEFYNIATSSAIDGSSSSSTSPTAGSITTTTPGDLIYEWGASLSTFNGYGGTFNGASIASGTNFTLLSADLQAGSCDQYYVQPAAGAINPSFAPSGSATWGSLALALKTASAGTAPGTGIRIVHVQHTLIGSTTGGGIAPIPLQFPSSGNLLVGAYNYLPIKSVSDSAGNAWSCPSSLVAENTGNDQGSQIVYAANATTSPNLKNLFIQITGGTEFQGILVLYDVIGAATSPYDTGATTFGQQTANGNLTTASITPSSSNGLVFATVAVGFQTVNGLLGSNYILDSVVNTQDDDNPGGPGTQNSSLDEDNGFAHVYNTSTSELAFVWTLKTSLSGGAEGENGAEYWSAVAASFKATPTTGPAPLAPANLHTVAP